MLERERETSVRRLSGHVNLFRTMVDAEIQADGEDMVDAPGGRRHVMAADTSESRRTEIIAIVRKLSCVVNEIHGKTERLTSELSEDDDVIRSGLNYVAIIKEALDELLRFVESPLGQRATALLWRYLDGIRYLAEVGAGIFISSMFVVVAQELLLDVKDDDFDLARRRINHCITFVQSKVPEIERRVSEAAELLQRVRQHNAEDAVARGDNRQLEDILWRFKDTIRHAKLDIDDCDSELKNANKQIEIAMAKIKAKMWLNGACRGALLAGGALTIYISFKTQRLSMMLTLAIGVSLSCASILVRVPRYRKLERDFLEYKATHDSLQDELRRLQRRLESHEHAVRN